MNSVHWFLVASNPMCIAGRFDCVVGVGGIPATLGSDGSSVNGMTVGCQPFLPILILARSTAVPSSARFQSELNVILPDETNLKPLVPPASCDSKCVDVPCDTPEGCNCTPLSTNMSMRPLLSKSAMMESGTDLTI